MVATARTAATVRRRRSSATYRIRSARSASACSARSRSSEGIGSAPYPARSTAWTIFVMSAAGSSRTVARSVARFTSADATPGTDLSADSTLTTHDAQVMPVIARSRFSAVAVVIGYAGG